MAVFGGSKSTTVVEDKTTTNTLQPVLDSVDAPTVAGNQGDVNLTVTTTDAGATKAALDANQAVTQAVLKASTDTAFTALAQSDHTLGEALAFSLDALKTTAGASTQSVLGAVATQGLAQQETAQTITKYMLYAAAIIAAAFVLPKLIKG